MRQQSAPAVTSSEEAWIAALRSPGPGREEAAARLHGLLLRAARFELVRRGQAADRLDSIDDLAMQCADSALVAILGKLDEFRHESRFTTWAYKFAILEAAVRSRRRAWGNRELPVAPEALPEQNSEDPVHDVIARDRLRRIAAAIDTELTAHQREVLTMLVLADVPIDVLAERLNTTRGALYKTLHDARRKLRGALEGDLA